MQHGDPYTSNEGASTGSHCWRTRGLCDGASACNAHGSHDGQQREQCGSTASVTHWSRRGRSRRSGASGSAPDNPAFEKLADTSRGSASTAAGTLLDRRLPDKSMWRRDVSVESTKGTVPLRLRSAKSRPLVQDT